MVSARRKRGVLSEVPQGDKRAVIIEAGASPGCARTRLFVELVTSQFQEIRPGLERLSLPTKGREVLWLQMGHKEFGRGA
ncbi:hypothetical protein NDU88_001503 [Pleurodeles waltl]|uniref:Uncharacterized protein n=1 Tax=Pleurodeles waltl TaxID=8319 RepID=A0AAV7L9R6_PLEWA|nr:hypothetical protein NDU88_001503 [Pleurodeles waltl]